jgi:hypothetical protein
MYLREPNVFSHWLIDIPELCNHSVLMKVTKIWKLQSKDTKAYEVQDVQV